MNKFSAVIEMKFSIGSTHQISDAQSHFENCFCHAFDSDILFSEVVDMGGRIVSETWVDHWYVYCLRLRVGSRKSLLNLQLQCNIYQQWSTLWSGSFELDSFGPDE